MRKWYFILKLFKNKFKKNGNGDPIGIEDNDDARIYKSIDAKLYGSGNNNIFFKKVKN